MLRAPITSDGSLGEWSVAGELPLTLGTHASFVHSGALHVVGGVEGGSTNTAAARRAAIGADDTLGAWEDLPALPKARAHAHQTPVVGDLVYSVGGAFEHTSMTDVFIGRFESE